MVRIPCTPRRQANQSLPQRTETEFERNVFVNCPYDEDDYPLLWPILFTIVVVPPFLTLQPPLGGRHDGDYCRSPASGYLGNSDCGDRRKMASFDA